MSDDGGAPRRAISYTRQRNTASKTRNAASSTRRRRNVPLCRTSASVGDGGDGGNRRLWFARRAAAWTDAEIKSHLLSGGTSKGGESYSMVGDVILGYEPRKERKGTKRARGCGTRFAWERRDGHYESLNTANKERSMAPAPTLSDIMDEKDKIDFMSPLNVGENYQLKEALIDKDSHNAVSNNCRHNNFRVEFESRRRNNAASAEIAQVSGVVRNCSFSKTSHESIGWHLLRVWGYRRKLGMAFVPFSGHANKIGHIDIDNEVAREMKEAGEKAAMTHEAKWLASRGLRVVPLPSIQNKIDPNEPPHEDTETGISNRYNEALIVPLPKINTHGIGYDPFKNAPEFRAFHEQRRALAKKYGRGSEYKVKNGYGKRVDRYFTADLWKSRCHGFWEKMHDDGSNDMSDECDYIAHKAECWHPPHYATDHDYADFIGTKASTGFALEDEDDGDVYHDEEGSSAFPSRGKNRHQCGINQYALEVQCPVSSDEEVNRLDGGLLGKTSTVGSTGRVKMLVDDGKVAEAWGAWCIVGAGSDDTVGGSNVETTTMDGEPSLAGFELVQIRFGNADSRQKSDSTPKRWKGPMPPWGYVLKRHVYGSEDNDIPGAHMADRIDFGLGLDLRHQRRRWPSQSFVPVFPPLSVVEGKWLPSERMLAKDGTELSYHAVRESMKSRFVSSSGGETPDVQESVTPESDDNTRKIIQDLDTEEWAHVATMPWVPTQLLYKRWGLSVLSSARLSITASDGSTSLRSKENDYFCKTISKPVVTVHCTRHGHAQKESNEDRKPIPTNQNANSKKNQGILIDTDGVEDDDTCPPPVRPSDALFQSIFDAESDMDTSSDDSEEEDKLHVDGRDTKHVAFPSANAQRKNDESVPICVGLSSNHHKGSDPKSEEENSSIMDEFTDSNGSSSNMAIKQRYRGSCYRHRSRDDSIHMGEHQQKRRNKKKYRRRRQWDSDVETEDESKGHDSYNRRRRKKKGRQKHRSYSRHNRSKHRT